MKKFIVLDTETAPTADCPKDGQAHADCSNVYDLGYIVADRKGNIYERHSLLITDIFFNDNMMDSAYYAHKRPIYKNGLGSGEWRSVQFLTAYNEFQECVKRHNVREIWAYNINFDKQTLNRTTRDLSHGWRKWFFPFGVTLRDIWDFAGSTICDTAKYVKWCKANGYMTKTGNPVTNAETVYRYITGSEFTEAHTALADCEIELAILGRCLRRKKKSPTTCGQGWRKPAARAKKCLA